MSKIGLFISPLNFDLPLASPILVTGTINHQIAQGKTLGSIFILSFFSLSHPVSSANFTDCALNIYLTPHVFVHLHRHLLFLVTLFCLLPEPASWQLPGTTLAPICSLYATAKVVFQNINKFPSLLCLKVSTAFLLIFRIRSELFTLI